MTEGRLLSAEELEGLRLALSGADREAKRSSNAGDWASVAGTRGAAAKLLLSHIAALSRPAKDVEGLVGRLAEWAASAQQQGERVSLEATPNFSADVRADTKAGFFMQAALLREAAAALTALARERDVFRAKLAAQCGQTLLLARALEPFAEATDDEDGVPYVLHKVSEFQTCDFTSGDFNRAIAALEQVGLSRAGASELREDEQRQRVAEARPESKQ